MIKPITTAGYKLLHDGSLALAQVEANGICMDTKYLNKAIEHTTKQIYSIQEKMKQDKVYKLWRKAFGTKTNLGSRPQLGKVIFDIMKYPCKEETKTGRPKTDASALENINLPFIKKLLRVEKLKKAKSTYLQGFLDLIVDGKLHPSFNLNIVATFRSSSSDPNFHNIPVRDPVIEKLVRRAFIARRNCQIAEVDYGGVEISGACGYHKDPRMISYVKDDSKDLHRDLAAQIYKLIRKQVTKDVRYCGKNMFIFPQFYGDWYLSCAEHLWEAINKMKLQTIDGVPLKEHLQNKGIKRLGACDPKEKPKNNTFEKHLKEVEDDFWNERFSVYGQWKLDWWDAYQEKGYFDTLTGFRIGGILDRKQVINYPIQGSAFHWLLWSLIRIQKLLKKYNMRTLIVGQIHDSIVSDVYKKELRNYLEIAKQVMTIDVRKHWSWINVPLKIEAEVAPVGGNWYEKKEVKIIR